MEKIKEYILARRYMFQYKIKRGKVVRRLTKRYMLKDLLSFECYSIKELKKLDLPELVGLYVGASTGGTTAYNPKTGKEAYVGYIS